MAGVLATAAVGVVKHSLLRTISVLCTLAVIVGLGWSVYVVMIRPHTKGTFQTKQEAEQITNITNNYPERRGFINLDMLWGWVEISLGPQKEVKK